MRNSIRAISHLSAIALIFNLVWENLQAPLYQGYNNFLQHFSKCFWAALGDVAIILFLYALFVAVSRDSFWFRIIDWKTALILLALGATIAVGIEKWTLLTGRWSYSEAMPIIPLLNVGLMPVLQMMGLPILIFFITSKINTHK